MYYERCRCSEFVLGVQSYSLRTKRTKIKYKNKKCKGAEEMNFSVNMCEQEYINKNVSSCYYSYENEYNNIASKFEKIKKLSHPNICTYYHMSRTNNNYILCSEYYTLSLYDLLNDEDINCVNFKCFKKIFNKKIYNKNKNIYKIYNNIKHPIYNNNNNNNNINTIDKKGKKKKIIDSIILNNIIYQILSAVQYLHSHDITFLNLTPHNILITDEGHIKLHNYCISYLFHNVDYPFTYKENKHVHYFKNKLNDHIISKNEMYEEQTNNNNYLDKLLTGQKKKNYKINNHMILYIDQYFKYYNFSHNILYHVPFLLFFNLLQNENIHFIYDVYRHIDIFNIGIIIIQIVNGLLNFSFILENFIYFYHLQKLTNLSYDDHRAKEYKQTKKCINNKLKNITNKFKQNDINSFSDSALYIKPKILPSKEKRNTINIKGSHTYKHKTNQQIHNEKNTQTMKKKKINRESYKKKKKYINKEQHTIEQIYQHALLLRRKIVDIQEEKKTNNKYFKTNYTNNVKTKQTNILTKKKNAIDSSKNEVISSTSFNISENNKFKFFFFKTSEKNDTLFKIQNVFILIIYIKLFYIYYYLKYYKNKKNKEISLLNVNIQDIFKRLCKHKLNKYSYQSKYRHHINKMKRKSYNNIIYEIIKNMIEYFLNCKVNISFIKLIENMYSEFFTIHLLKSNLRNIFYSDQNKQNGNEKTLFLNLLHKCLLLNNFQCISTSLLSHYYFFYNVNINKHKNCLEINYTGNDTFNIPTNMSLLENTTITNENILMNKVNRINNIIANACTSHINTTNHFQNISHNNNNNNSDLYFNYNIKNDNQNITDKKNNNIIINNESKHIFNHILLNQNYDNITFNSHIVREIPPEHVQEINKLNQEELAKKNYYNPYLVDYLLNVSKWNEWKDKYFINKKDIFYWFQMLYNINYNEELMNVNSFLKSPNILKIPYVLYKRKDGTYNDMSLFSFYKLYLLKKYDSNILFNVYENVSTFKKISKGKYKNIKKIIKNEINYIKGSEKKSVYTCVQRKKCGNDKEIIYISTYKLLKNKRFTIFKNNMFKKYMCMSNNDGDISDEINKKKEITELWENKKKIHVYEQEYNITKKGRKRKRKKKKKKRIPLWENKNVVTQSNNKNKSMNNYTLEKTDNIYNSYNEYDAINYNYDDDLFISSNFFNISFNINNKHSYPLFNDYNLNTVGIYLNEFYEIIKDAYSFIRKNENSINPKSSCIYTNSFFFIYQFKLHIKYNELLKFNPLDTLTLIKEIKSGYPCNMRNVIYLILLNYNYHILLKKSYEKKEKIKDQIGCILISKNKHLDKNEIIIYSNNSNVKYCMYSKKYNYKHNNNNILLFNIFKDKWIHDNDLIGSLKFQKKLINLLILINIKLNIQNKYLKYLFIPIILLYYNNIYISYKCIKKILQKYLIDFYKNIYYRNEYIYIFNSLLNYYLPELSMWFFKNNINIIKIIKSWIYSLFCAFFDLQNIYLLLDNILIQPSSYIIFICISILMYLKKYLMNITTNKNIYKKVFSLSKLINLNFILNTSRTLFERCPKYYLLFPFHLQIEGSYMNEKSILFDKGGNENISNHINYISHLISDKKWIRYYVHRYTFKIYIKKKNKIKNKNKNKNKKFICINNKTSFIHMDYKTVDTNEINNNNNNNYTNESFKVFEKSYKSNESLKLKNYYKYFLKCYKTNKQKKNVNEFIYYKKGNLKNCEQGKTKVNKQKNKIKNNNIYNNGIAKNVNSHNNMNNSYHELAKNIHNKNNIYNTYYELAKNMNNKKKKKKKRFKNVDIVKLSNFPIFPFLDIRHILNDFCIDDYIIVDMRSLENFKKKKFKSSVHVNTFLINLKKGTYKNYIDDILYDENLTLKTILLVFNNSILDYDAIYNFLNLKIKYITILCGGFTNALSFLPATYFT
ncbi:Rab GTPase activator and protein kinase, putative [Plasmodium gaboni]|uniref:Rab GTPase activator and protein kinase, putative n=1 Tax=Plasmodium gaboni TaxID=647221 RepID=A0ABY1ULD9_9APIC|nr:Rab GTPase activator and protein kinase, putative [Plasmodium gaboni]